MLIQDTTFVVTDTETTGAIAAEDRLIEIAAVKVVGGVVVDRFASLINPERSVPRRITEITGITTAMVFDQPRAGEVLPRFLDFLGDSVFVAHNLPFDRGFIDAELARQDLPPLRNPMLCTLRLARRLLKGLPSKGLTSVADFYRVTIQNRHRALGDAEATAEVLGRFLSQLQFEGIRTLEELLAFQYSTYNKPKQESRHLARIRTEVLPRLPDRPGVYFMKDGRGAILYIGKAKSLRARVRSYFTGIEGHAERTRKLVQAVRDITWTETGSELGALLLESRLIKEHQPRFNRALRRYRNRPFIRLDMADDFPRVSWTSYLFNDGAEYFGPLGGRNQAELVVELINRFFKLRECDDSTFARRTRCLYAEMNRCEAPCEGGEHADRYTEEVRRVRDFLTGRDASILERVRDEMKAAAARLDFEQAATYRDWLRQLEHMLGKQQCVAAPVLEHHGVLLLPGLEAGTVQLFLVRFGRHVETLTLPVPPDDAAVAAMRARLARHFDPAQQEPDRYFKQEVDEIRVLAHWMYVYRETARQIPWWPGKDLDAFVDEILQQAARPSAEEQAAIDEDY